MKLTMFAFNLLVASVVSGGPAWKEVQRGGGLRIGEKGVGECKTRWKTIRDSYRKQARKLGTGSAAIRSKYDSQKLQFLNSVAFQRESKTNIIIVPETQSSLPETAETQLSVPDTESAVPDTQLLVPETQSEVPETQSVVLQNEFTHQNTTQVPEYFNVSHENVDGQRMDSTTDAENSDCSSASQLGTKRKRNDMLADEMKKSRIQREMLINKFAQKKERERDPIDIFFEGVAATVKTFSPELIIETKLAVTKLVSEMELRALSLQRSSTEKYILSDEGDVYLQFE